MKRQILFYLIVLTTFSYTWAAPALRGIITVRQPDGTQLKIEQFGDEYHHWTETTDGTLVINKGGSYYVAAIDDSGELSATKLLAHELPLRNSMELQLVAQQAARKALFHQQQEKVRSRSLDISTNRGYLPHKGRPHVLTILAAFQDSTFTINEPVMAFEQYLNGETQIDLGNKNDYNLTSVQKYFNISSHGQFTPEFDIVGPITLPHELAYYGNRFYNFCKDAVEQTKDLVSDWTLYDNDGDGSVELVCIIFAGYGQNQGGGEETIWAKASLQNIKIDNGMKINFFNCSPEHFYPIDNIDADGMALKDYINGTGVFIHELSHCMGLPDLYQTTKKYANNQGMESWDVMDYGLYNRNGFAPAAYTAWEQEVMGWIEIEPVTMPQHVKNIIPLEEGGKAYKIVNPNYENECIVMENIAIQGLNSYAYGSGLLVYHVAYPYNEVNFVDCPNDELGKPCVAVVPASGVLLNSTLCGTGKQYTRNQWKESMASALFPGKSSITELTEEMQLPNYVFFNSDDSTTPVGVSLYDITYSDKGISFDVRPSAPDGILTIQPSSSDSLHDYYDLSGRNLGSSPKHSHGIYIDKKTKKKYLK